jgi:hypothetical protein
MQIPLIMIDPIRFWRMNWMEAKSPLTRENIQPQRANHRRTVHRACTYDKGSARQKRVDSDWILLVSLGSKARFFTASGLDTAMQEKSRT